MANQCVYEKMKIQQAIAIQLGARRRYAIPMALLAKKRLEKFYTDICLSPREARAINAVISATRQSFDISRRCVPKELAAKTVRFPSWTMAMRSANHQTESDIGRLLSTQKAHENAGAKMLQAGFGNATHIVTMFGEGGNFVKEAHQRGLIVVTDMNIAPSTERIVFRECQIYPKWGKSISYFGELVSSEHSFRPVTDQVIDSTNIYLCPSEFVQADLIENYNVNKASTRLVPYSIHPDWFTVSNSPAIGYILFMGTADIRKGIHIVCEVASILKSRKSTLKIRVAGHVTPEVYALAKESGIEFMGKLTTPRIRQELSQADLVFFPSIAEGSAGVTYEALASGVPVVTTPEAGSIVRNNMDGIVMNMHDRENVADILEELVSDRVKRDAMSKSARAWALAHDWDNFADRLDAAVFGPSTK